MRLCVSGVLVVAALCSQPILAQQDAETQNPFWQNEYCVNPSAPYAARLNPTSGQVSVRFDITAEGKPENIRITETSATEGGKRVAGALARSATRALKRWEYFAYIQGDIEAPRFDVSLTFNYVDHDTDVSDLTDNQRCVTSVMPEPPSHSGDPADAYVNLAQCMTPNMPTKADREGRSGQASVTFNITKKGKLTNIVLADGQQKDEFAEEALRALKQWRYEPFMKAGKPIEREKVSVDFVFGDAGPDSEEISCTHAPLGTSRKMKALNQSPQCKISWNDGVPVPSKGCIKDID